jgi:hypothetical protein
VKASTAAVHVLKIAAAQRQLDAAIRMTFANEDPLAVHTVAAAAGRVLRDLAKKRGHKVLAEQMRDSWLGTILALARGDMPDKDVQVFKENAHVWAVLCQLADQIKELGLEKKTPSELASVDDWHISPAAEKRHWAEFNKIANFLKHADYDGDHSITEDEADPQSVLTQACLLYVDLTGQPTPEMQVWTTYAIWVKRDRAPPKADKGTQGEWTAMIAELLRSVPPAKRHVAALECIRILKE